ncbi:MAG TPA: ABC transporter ATP-binding protein [Steroidobacteraceae bacterium]
MIINTDNLYKAFGKCDALRGLSMAVPEESVFALIGANGAGKTTTIKVLMNLVRPTAGSATVLGVDSRRLSPRERSQIGYVSENQEMPGRLRVGQYLDYLRPLYSTWDPQLEQTVLQQLNLPMDRRIKDLSHGMRLKMALACALPFKPKLLVLDEPFSGLDSLIREEFMEQLLLQAGEMTILISSHELADIEGAATHVAYIEQGQLLFQEGMDELFARTREVRVTLKDAAIAPPGLPVHWLGVKTVGSVISFVDVQFREDQLQERLPTLLTGICDVQVQPVALKDIFTTLARAAQAGKLPT